MTRSLFNTPRRRRYDIGGARDNVNSVTGSSWGAGKGMVGSSASKAGSYGASAGTMAGSIAAMAGVGASLGSAVPVIGTAIGAIAGVLGGIFAGRAKKRKAEKAAREADKTHNYEIGQDAIRTDQVQLDQTTINQNPLDIYGDNPQPVSTPGISQVNPQAQQKVNPANGLPYRLGGSPRHYAGGGQILQVASDAAVVNGPSHEQGGVPYGPNAEVEGGEAIMQGSNADYIFSDTLKIGNRTFADAAKPLMKHKGYLEQQLGITGLMLGKALQLTERSTYAIDRNTNNREAEKSQAKYSQILQQIQQTQAELDALYNQQEAMKAEAGEMSEPRTERRFGGGVRKYRDAGAVTNWGYTGSGTSGSIDLQTGPQILNEASPDILAAENPNTSVIASDTPNALANTADASSKGMSSGMASAISGAINIGLSAWGQAAEAKKQRAFAQAPSHVQQAIAGFRLGGRKRYIDGGSIQVSPYADIPYAENPTTERVNKLMDLSSVLEDIKILGGRTRKFKPGSKNSLESRNAQKAHDKIYNDILKTDYLLSDDDLSSYINSFKAPNLLPLTRVNDSDWNIDDDLQKSTLGYRLKTFFNNAKTKTNKALTRSNETLSNGLKNTIDKISNSEYWQDEKGNLIKAGGNLLTGLLAAGSTKKLAKALSEKAIPERELLDRFTQEWDVNTDAARKEIIDQVQAYERFAKDNTSNAQIARQLVLKGRSNGAKALGKLKQDELLQELGIRNETRKVNKDIEAKNKEIKYQNKLDKFNQQMQALSMLNDSNNQKLNTINGLFSDIGFTVNDHIRTKRERAANLIHLLNDEEAMKRAGQLDIATLFDAFGKNNSNILTKPRRKGDRVKKCA
ncbi:MAG: hypothetical protein HDQ88_04700 [Clostridia bacterium]|nr:hypothetical protein [Clostridia bacterium]